MKKWRPLGAEWVNLKILNPLEPEGGIYEKHERVEINISKSGCFINV